MKKHFLASATTIKRGQRHARDVVLHELDENGQTRPDSGGSTIKLLGKMGLGSRQERKKIGSLKEIQTPSGGKVGKKVLAHLFQCIMGWRFHL